MLYPKKCWFIKEKETRINNEIENPALKLNLIFFALYLILPFVKSYSPICHLTLRGVCYVQGTSNIRILVTQVKEVMGIENCVLTFQTESHDLQIVTHFAAFRDRGRVRWNCIICFNKNYISTSGYPSGLLNGSSMPGILIGKNTASGWEPSSS